MRITFINPKLTSIASRDIHAVPEGIREVIAENPVIQKNLKFMRKAFSGLGLITIAAVVPDDVEAEFIDENMEEIDLDRKFEMVALSGNLDQLNSALKLCDVFKKKNVPVIVGGPAAITFPDLYTRKGATVVIGEGEELFLRYLDDFSHGKVRPVYDDSLGNSHVSDLADLPSPRYDLAAKYDYSIAGVQFTRGCPYHCSFCQERKIFGNKVRLNPVEKTIEEIKTVKKYWPDKLFFFYDDNPFIHRKHAIKLFSRLFSQEKISLGNWGSSADITLHQDEEMMQLITAGGPVCYLGIGFESLSEMVLRSANNKMKLDNMKKYKEAIEIFRQHRITPVGYFIVGFENDSVEGLETLLEFVRETKIAVEIGRLTPLPGTILYDELKQRYQAEHGELKTVSSLAEWGRIHKYLKEKSKVKDEVIEKYLTEIFRVIYSDNRCLEEYMDKEIPYCIHF